MEQFDDLVEWAQTAQLDGCAIRQDSRGIYWAENWEGKSCGEYNPTDGQGFLHYS